MNGSLQDAASLTEGILKLTPASSTVEVLLLPSYLHTSLVRQLAEDKLKIGAQNLQVGEKGAYTGEVSGPMLKDAGCEYVLVGHSERRAYYGETNDVVAKKFASAIQAGLRPILCVGETEKEREENLTEAVIAKQTQAVIDVAGISAFRNAVIAYEPVWAIGTGKTATPEEAEQVHVFIRKLIGQNSVDIASTIRILYGGSMKPSNAESLLAMPNIDGGLIGGAALDAESFSSICHAASMLTKQKALKTAN